MKTAGRIFSLLLLLVLCSACGVVRVHGDGADVLGDKASVSLTTQLNSRNTLVFAQSSEPRSLDPGALIDSESAKVTNQIYETLLRFNPKTLALEPGLAERWSVSEDGLTYVFHLRRGVYFHDGQAFDAAAVRANIARYQGPEAAHLPYGDLVYGRVAAVETPNAYTVVVRMRQADTPFLNNLAIGIVAPMASPAAIEAGTLAQQPVGTGPFVFGHWLRGREILLLANGRYWGDGPRMRAVRFRFISENSARVLAMNTEDVQITDGLEAESLTAVREAGNVAVRTPGMNTNYLACNVTRPAMQKREVRQAVCQAIDVPEVVAAVYGDGAQAAKTFLPPMVPGYSPSVRPIAYNPGVARQAFAEAGVRKLVLLTYIGARPYSPNGGQPLAGAIQGYLARVGVETEVRSVSWVKYRKALAAGDYDLCLHGWIGDNGDADNFMNLAASRDPVVNVARFDDDFYRAGVAEAVKLPNGPAREAAYRRLDQYLIDQAVWLPLVHMDLFSAHRSDVADYIYPATAALNLREVYLKN